MMKYSRLAASSYSIFVGTCWRNTRIAVPSSSTVAFCNRRHCQINGSFQAQGFESSSWAVHSPALEDDAFSELGPAISESSAKKIKLVTEKHDHFLDDDFSELGPGISEGSAKQIKLITEKVDHFLRTHPHRRELPSRPRSSNNRLGVRDILTSIGKASTTSGPKIGGHGHTSKFSDDTRMISDIESPRSVSIKNIPSTVALTELVEAISVFGKVSGASFVTACNRLRCCNIEFEDVDSFRRAILSGKVTVGSKVFPVDPLDAVDLVTIRIENINEKTADYEIQSMCKSVGEFVGLTRTKRNCVDAFFNVRNHTIHLDIAKKLNNTTLDLHRWSAHVLTSNSKSAEVPSDEEARYRFGLQIFYHLSKLKQQVAMKRIYLEDLEYLNASIMHIGAVPPTTNQSGSS